MLEYCCQDDATTYDLVGYSVKEHQKVQGGGK